MFDLTKEELRIMCALSTPQKIQDFLDTLPINWEKKGETCMSPRRVLREHKAHCIEAAMLAAAALWLHGGKPLLMDLRATSDDDDHVVALFRQNGCWGAISKTNHATARYRDPIYRTLRELAVSYFHEYFLDTTGKKVLREYSRPLSLKRLGSSWITAEEDLFAVAVALDDSPHYQLLLPGALRYVRPADQFDRIAGKIIEWRRSDPRT